MKIFYSFLFLVATFSCAYAQEPVDSLEIGKDTLSQLHYQLEEVYVSNKFDFKSEEERKKYNLLKRRVLTVYPYAKIAADRLSALNQGMAGLKSDRDKKKYMKIVEKYLTDEFEAKLKKLSRKQGQILIKLIHRQTGTTTFELIANLKSGWKAFWSNNTARLFDLNLKTKYDPYNVSEDFLIEGILYQAFTSGRLPKQESKVPMEYAELAKSWREKIKATKSE